MPEPLSDTYRPSAEEQEKIKFVYTEYQYMDSEVMNKTYPEFCDPDGNHRTLKKFIDDSQKRVNSYVLSRESLGKESWQANVFTGTTRNKVRAYCSSVTKEPPMLQIVAVNDDNVPSVERGEVMEDLIRHSYIAHDNPELAIFRDGWNCSVNGTVIIYDGYLKVKGKVKVITDYDPLTGKVEIEEKEEVIEDRPFEKNIPPTRLMIRDAFISDIQNQPALIEMEYLDRDEFDMNYGRFKNSRFVKIKSGISQGDRDLFFGQHWNERTGANNIEVLKYYNKRKDIYRIIANGVLILDAPMLWGRKKKKYPYAKTLFEPFANTDFFWGNSLANIMLAWQDAENAVTNGLLDKTYRSLQNPMVIGVENRDSLELEDQWLTGDTKIYVNNVNAVRPLEIPQVNGAELQMLEKISQRLSMVSLDALQEGYSQQGSTAREIVISNEHSTEIKGLFFKMLKDLWLQKTRLRLLSVLQNYNKTIVKVVGRKTVRRFPVYTLNNIELADGRTGTREIRLAEKEKIDQMNRKVGFSEPGKQFNEVDVEEAAAELKSGVPTEIIYIPSDYLDDWMYDIVIETESVYQRNKSLYMALAIEKTEAVARLFPDVFAQNKNQFFRQLIKVFEDSPEKYQMPPEAAPQAAMPQAQPGQSVQQLTAPTSSLGELAAV